MTRRLLALLTVATLALVAACGSDPEAERGSEGGSGGGSGSSGDLAAFCDQFDAVMPIMFFAGFASAFAELDEEDDEAQAVAGYFPLLFSQQLRAFYAEAAKVTSGATSAALETAADAYADGVEYLKRAGFTTAEIEALARIDVRNVFAEEPELEDFGDGIDEKALAAEARSFQQSIDEIEAEIDAADNTDDEALEDLLEECATAITGGTDPCELLTADEVEAALGVDASPSGPETGFGTGAGCSWEADDAELGVFVATSNHFTQMQGNYDDGNIDYTTVRGVGDEAMLVDGFSSASSFSTDGATLVILDGDRTVTVAIERDDAPIGESDLVPLAKKVLDRLG